MNIQHLQCIWVTVMENTEVMVMGAKVMGVKVMEVTLTEGMEVIVREAHLHTERNKTEVLVGEAEVRKKFYLVMMVKSSRRQTNLKSSRQPMTVNEIKI